MMNIKQIVILALVITRSIIYGQYIQNPADIDSRDIYPLNIDSLQKSGIDTFFIYKTYCYNDASVECEQSDKSYVFFKSKGETFITKYNECHKFSTLKSNASQSFSYFISNFHKLVPRDSIRQATYIDKKGNKQEVGTDHSCYSVLFLSMMNYRFFFLDMMDFRRIIHEFSDYNNKHLNIYYSYNEQTNTKTFINKIQADIKGLKFTQIEPNKK